MKTFTFFVLLAFVVVSLAQVGKAEEEDTALEGTGRELNSFVKKDPVKFCHQGCGYGYYCKTLSKKFCGFKKVCAKKKISTCLYQKKFYVHGKVFKKCAKYGFKFVTKCDDVYACDYKICVKKTGFKTFKKKKFVKFHTFHG